MLIKKLKDKKTFKLVLLLSFIIIQSIFNYYIIYGEDFLTITYYKGNVNLTYKNFTTPVPIYKTFKITTSSEIQTNNGMIELLDNNKILRVSSGSKLIIDLENKIFNFEKGRIYILTREKVVFSLFNSQLMLESGEYYLEKSPDSLKIISNEGSIFYKGESINLGNKKNRIILLKDKYTIGFENFNDDKRLNFVKDLILNEFITLKKFYSYYSNTILSLLDQNNSYIVIINNLNKNFTKFKNDIDLFKELVKKEKDQEVIYDKFIELYREGIRNEYKIEELINTYLIFYYQCLNNINYFYTLENILNLIGKRKNLDVFWATNYSSKYSLLNAKFKGMNDTLKYFKKAVEGNKTIIFDKDSEVVYYIENYLELNNKLIDILKNYYYGVYKSIDRAIINSFVNTITRFNYFNIITSYSINKVYSLNYSMDQYFQLIKNYFMPEITIDEIIYRINISDYMVLTLKEMLEMEKELDNYMSIFNYMKMRKTNKFEIFNRKYKYFKNFYNGIKAAMLDYYRILKDFDETKNKIYFYALSKIEYNRKGEYQLEFNNSLEYYNKYINWLNNDLKENFNYKIIFESVLEIEYILINHIYEKYEFYRKRFKTFYFNRMYIDLTYKNIKSLLKKVSKEKNEVESLVKLQNYKTNFEIAILVLEELNKKTSDFILNLKFSESNFEIKFLINILNVRYMEKNNSLSSKEEFIKLKNNLSELYFSIYNLKTSLLNYQNILNELLKEYKNEVKMDKFDLSKIKKSEKKYKLLLNKLLNRYYHCYSLLNNIRENINNLNLDDQQFIILMEQLKDYINDLFLYFDSFKEIFMIESLIYIKE